MVQVGKEVEATATPLEMMIPETVGGQGMWGLEEEGGDGPASVGKVPPGDRRVPWIWVPEKSQCSDAVAVGQQGI